MLYVVDGHNLIGKMPGMSLAMLDDEEELLNRLRPFVLAKRGRKIEVFFDKAPPGHAGTRSYGVITAHFVPTGTIADDAIAHYLKQLKGAARSGVIVVSSDHQVQASARAAGAQVLLSEAFADQVLSARDEAGAADRLKASARPGGSSRSAASSALSEAGLSEREVSDWLKEFHVDPSQADRPIEPPPTQTKVRQVDQTHKPKKTHPRPHHGFKKKGSG